MNEALEQKNGTNRRDFLFKAAVGLAAVVGLGAAARSRLFKGRASPFAVDLPEDSIFMPRADQRDRVLGGK